MTTDTGPNPSITTSLAPMLSVRNGGAGAVEGYKSAFGAIEVYRVEPRRCRGHETLDRGQNSGSPTNRPSMGISALSPCAAPRPA